jgi:hypothetical protein
VISLDVLERTARRVAVLVIADEAFAPVLDRLEAELERARRMSPKERARRLLRDNATC